jgi:hypothetical protein
MKNKLKELLITAGQILILLAIIAFYISMCYKYPYAMLVMTNIYIIVLLTEDKSKKHY